MTQPRLDDPLWSAVDALYEAATSSEEWSDAMDLVVNAFGGIAADCTIAYRAGAAHVAVGGVFRDQWDVYSHEYLQHYANIDTRRQLAMRLPVGTIFACHEHFDQRFRERDPYFRFTAQHDFVYAAGGVVCQTPDFAFIFGVHRTAAQGVFECEELERVRWMVPHLRRVGSIHSRIRALAARERSLSEALDKAPYGTMLVAGRKVVWSNQAAESVLTASDGLTAAGGALVAAFAADDRELGLALSEAQRVGARAARGVRIHRPSDRSAYLLLVAPSSANVGFHDSSAGSPALVIVHDPEARPVPRGRRLMELFQLTQAEAALAVDLLTGERLGDIAERRGLRMTTLRTQLRAILSKTGTGRQSDLMRLLSALGDT